MEPMTTPTPTPPSLPSQTQSGQTTTHPSSTAQSEHDKASSDHNIIKESNNKNSSDLRNNTKRKRRRDRLSSSDAQSDNATNANSTAQLTSSTTSSASRLGSQANISENCQTKIEAGQCDLLSPTSSAPASKIRSTTIPNIDNKESSTTSTQPSSTKNEKTSADEELFGTIPDSLPSNKPAEKTNPNTGQNQGEKVPKSSLRKTSSTRSALSLVFDISQNQTISRSTSAASSRCESRQSRFHTECQPVEDPSLKVENWSRSRSLRSPRARSSSSTRAGSESSLLGRRESVTNLIFAGQSHIDSEDGGLETIYWKKLQLQYTPRGSVQFNKMAATPRESDVTPGDFNVTVDEDYSLSRPSKVNTPSSSIGRHSSPSRCRTGFLYQVTDFDRLSKDVPSFVRHYAQKNGKMITESFILRLNYLRRRRQLGENSSTINIGNNNNNNNNTGHGHHSHGSGNNNNNNNMNNVGKRTNPTTV